ncbi:MAG TPA: peptidase M6, partial [Thermaerobacter sp.]
MRAWRGGAGRRGLAAVLTGVSLAVTAWVGPAPVTAAAPETSPQPMDIGPEVRDKVLPIDPKSAASIQAGRRGMGVMAEQSNTYDPVPGTERHFLALDYVEGGYYFKPFVLRGVSENAEVWVAKDLSFPEGDPRNDRIEVTDEQVQYLLQQYESNIRPKEMEFFGPWDEHDGSQALLVEWEYVPEGYYQSSDGKGRDIILVDNIKDENYTDPTYPSYVAGFYSSTFELYFDRNIVTIDN